jgi:hypothetical protein
MANPEPILLNNLHILAQGCTHNDGGAGRNGGFCFTFSTPTTARQDSGNELWDMYLDEVKEEDKRISDAWKEDSNGILVFVSPNLLIFLLASMTSSKTGLFSATVGAFIIEFYKTLSPNSGNQTTSPPSASMIWVNSMWLISLVLSLTSALLATLLQQWARRYVETPKAPNEPKDRARVRSFLSLGTESYKMRLAVEIALALLHLSVYLFFAGLVIVFHTINKKVAIAVDVAVGLFVLAYIALSILPCIDVQCPYRTPMSYILWYPCHFVSFFAKRCLLWFLGRLHRYLVHSMTDGQRIVTWLESCENVVNTHWQYFTDGLGKSIINDTTKAQGDMDSKIVTLLFSKLALGDRSKLRKFAARIPRDQVRNLIPPTMESLREPLHTLLRSCAAGTHLAGPDEDVRKRSLLVCLDAIRYIAKGPDVPNLDFVRTNFAGTVLMEALRDDGSDTSIRISISSICALVAKQVIRETPTVPRLRWLCDITGEASDALYDADFVVRDHMNLKSFVYRVLSNQTVGDLQTMDVMSFKETLAILLRIIDDANFDTNDSQSRLSKEVQWIQEVDPQGSQEVVSRLRSMFPFLPAALPP